MNRHHFSQVLFQKTAVSCILSLQALTRSRSVIKQVMYTFRINPEPFTSAEDFHRLLAFLERTQLVARGSQVCWSQMPEEGLVSHPDYVQVENPTEPVNLEVFFLDNDRANIEKRLAKQATPCLLIGHYGVPQDLDHICIPVETGGQFNTDWLGEVMALASPHGIRLLHADHGFVVNEVMKMAQWFRMEAVRNSMREWLTEDLKTRLRDLMKAYPDAEVKAEVGRLIRAFDQEDPKHMLIMGCLSRGILLRNRHHGLAYGYLLFKTGASGYFIHE